MSSTPGRDSVKWDPAASPKAKRKAIEQRLQLACHFTQLSSHAPAHRAIGSSLARAQPTARWLRTLETPHQNFIAEDYALLRFVTDKRAIEILFGRMQVPRGSRRPKHSFEALGRDHGLSDRHAKRLYKRALDEIAAGLDAMSRI
jgi:hypothetical protein